MWEGALSALTCPREVMAAHRLVSVIGIDTVEFGIIPYSAQLCRSPGNGFWIYDRRLVIVETLSTEMWLDDEENLALYDRAWDQLADSGHGRLSRPTGRRMRTGMAGQILSWVTSCREGTDG
ncbi:Scr1 family TA system antitoxin-like transcriptional regulator [Streptomyces sp. NPDC005548]|uniref:Scr1 family TA system antitoxin-like transcriptional regulator n=1 Tax=Streptomyces sp. NPDC005548 TaxID=3364724 RepID=UPI00367A3FC7